MQWESRWGAGYPGWHIECSAMSMHYLGDRIDIHTGGVDHIPIHHENEIAQSDAYAGKRVVNTWMHGEFLQVDGGKMSKSLRNMYLISDLRAKGYNPLAYRYFCLNANYGSKLNFTWDGMRSAAVAHRRFIDGALAHGTLAHGGGAAANIDSAYLSGMAEAFDLAVNDDLNIPKALGIAWQLIRNPDKSSDIYELLLDMDEVLGLGIKEAAEEASGSAEAAPQTAPNAALQATNGDIPQEILALAEERGAARAAKDWKRSDELRDLIKEKGFAVLDTKQGAKIEKV